MGHDNDDEDFETRPEDTVPLWMIDDRELGMQLMRDDQERYREEDEPRHGQAFAEWAKVHHRGDAPSGGAVRNAPGSSTVQDSDAASTGGNMAEHRSIEQDAEARDPLPGLEEQLALEFGQHVPKERLHEVAEASLHIYDEARIREFVPVFAWRVARRTVKVALAAAL